MKRLPKTGAFIAYKKVYSVRTGEHLVAKLSIPASAKRVRGVFSEGKCRASKAKCLAIYDYTYDKLIKKLAKLKTARASHDESFRYRVGQTAYPHAFDSNRREVCSAGIHFFLTFHEAASW